MILPTHTNNSRHLYSIICRFVGECEGGFLLDKLGGLFSTCFAVCIFERWGIEGDRYIITLTLSHIHYSRHLYSITADLLVAVKGDY